MRCLYQVKELVPLARTVTQIFLLPSFAAISYQAGQYIAVEHADETSPLSIANMPDSNQMIELQLSHAPRNHNAHAILTLATQEKTLWLTGPFGQCTLDRIAWDKPIIFFVRGTGFAPVKAILESMQTLKNFPPVHLYWGVATKEDFYLQDLIAKWQETFLNFRFTSKVSRSADLHQLHDAVLEDYPDLSNYQVYASGGEEMVFSALGLFIQHGLKRNHFYSDMLPMEMNS